MATVTGLSDRLLTERLRELESEGVVRRTVIAGPPVRVRYELTAAGRALEPVIEALSHWAERWVTL
jgi:DNA-binding HxlR family transcriptional regulator